MDQCPIPPLVCSKTYPSAVELLGLDKHSIFLLRASQPCMDGAIVVIRFLRYRSLLQNYILLDTSSRNELSIIFWRLHISLLLHFQKIPSGATLFCETEHCRCDSKLQILRSS